MTLNSIARFAAHLSFSDGLLTGAPAYASCLPNCPDEILVTGEKWSPYEFGFWVMNIFYAGGVNGGGSGPFLQEASFLEDLGPEDAPFVVQQRHRIDLDDDGAADVTFSANFVVYGLDEDTNAIPDKWESLIETHRAWPF